MLALAPAHVACAEDVAPRHAGQTPGLSLGVGLGTSYALIGAQAGYYLPIADSGWSATPYASAGVFGLAGGTMVLLGQGTRLLLDLGYGPVGIATMRLHGQEVADQIRYGPSVQVGAEWMWPTGFYLRATAGVATTIGPEWDGHPTILALGVGLGRKQL